MRRRPAVHIADRAVAALRRYGVLWLLLAALPLQGLSAALIGLIGQRHFHEAVSSHALGRALQTADAAALARHEHAHAAMQRHHHDRTDASVVALDPLSDAGLDGPASDVTPTLLAPVPSVRVSARETGHTPWSLRDTGRFVSWSSEPPERPPKV